MKQFVCFGLQVGELPRQVSVGRGLLQAVTPLEVRVKLLRWLSSKEVGFDYVLRTGGHCKAYYRGKWRKLSQVPLEGQTRFVGAVRFTEERRYEKAHLIMHWAEGEDEPWHLLSSRPVGQHTLKRYEKRMWTEELYADLKGHGVDLEATGLVHTERISRLMMGACWTYVWLLVLGSYVAGARLAALGRPQKPARQKLLPHRMGLLRGGTYGSESPSVYALPPTSKSDR